MKVLVTGGTGFVGTALLGRLSCDGVASVRAAVRAPEVRLASGVEPTVVPDAGPDSSWGEALAGCDVVVHLAARVHVMQDSAADPLAEFRRVNVQGTLNLARQAAHSGVRRFVFVSSIKVNGEATAPGQAFGPDDPPAPQDAYAISKTEAEAGLRDLVMARAAVEAETGMEFVIVRAPLVYGPGVRANFQSLMRAISRGWPLPLGAIHNQRSLIALDNLVDLIALCTRHPMAANQTFLAADGHDLSTPEMVRRLALAMGKPARLLAVPATLLRLCAVLVGKGAAAQRLCGNLQIDISKTRDVLGWNPPVGVNEGLRRAATGYENMVSSSGFAPAKRTFDLIIAFCAAVLLAVPILVVAILVKLTSPGPVLYWSDRVGINNDIFRMPKFRSMRVDTPALATHLLPQPDAWLTPIGSFLRKSSLDELPQLWSIVKGDMSFVGPRPALFNQYDLITQRTEKGVHELVPGLTGWAQINGRDELPIPDKVALDVEYLRRKSFLFDLKILVLTAVKVIRRANVTH